LAISDDREKDHILVLHIEGGRDHFIRILLKKLGIEQFIKKIGD